MEEELQVYYMEWVWVENGTCRSDGRNHREMGACCRMQGLSCRVHMEADMGLWMSCRGPGLFCRAQLVLHIACVIAHRKRGCMKKNDDEKDSGHRELDFEG